MKKPILKSLSLAMMVVMLLCIFTGCSKKVESGTYSGKLEMFGQSLQVSYTFQGNKVTAESKVTLMGQVTTETATGTYELIENPDGTMEIKLNFKEDTQSFSSKTVTFEQGEDYIKLGGVQYNKAK